VHWSQWREIVDPCRQPLLNDEAWRDGDTRVSKALPINWLRDFLEKHAPACSGKYVFMDQGGELYNNPEVRKLFT